MSFYQRVKAKVTSLEQENAALQAKIDALMMEHCPEEMTEEQLAQWRASQASVTSVQPEVETKEPTNDQSLHQSQD